MRNVPIRFRAREAYTGSWVFGFYFEEHGNAFIFADDAVYHVDGDTIAQLVGYDSNGREVYEGDTVECYKSGDFRGTGEFAIVSRVDRDSLKVADWNIYGEDLNNPVYFKFVLKEAPK